MPFLCGTATGINLDDVYSCKRASVSSACIKQLQTMFSGLQRNVSWCVVKIDGRWLLVMETAKKRRTLPCTAESNPKHVAHNLSN